MQDRRDDWIKGFYNSPMNNLTTKIEVLKGDITTLKVDAIVNAANSSLLGGGGVDGAIHRAGGTQILDECKKIVAKLGNCLTGEAVITTAGKLSASYVIHTVGPIWRGGNDHENEKLTNCYRHSLQLAKEHHLKSIAFPGISTGIYGYPKDQAAQIAVNTVMSFLAKDAEIEKVYFVCFDEENYRLIKNAVTSWSI